MNRNYLVAILLAVVFVGYFHEYIFLGQDACIRVHDNLDSDVVYRYHLVHEHAIFAAPMTPIRPIMDGLPRVCLPTGFNIMIALYWLFGTFGGFVASEFLVHILAYIGIYILLKNHFLKEEKHFWMRHLAALFFAAMPFFPVTGGAVALQPLLLNGFLNIRKAGRLNWKDLLSIGIFPFYSSFVWAGLFVVIFMGGFSLYNLYTLGIKKSLPFIAAVAIFVGLSVIADYQLFLVFFDPGGFFVSHRTKFKVELNYNLKGVMSMGLWNATSGIYHSTVYAGFVFFIAPLIVIVNKVVRREPIFGDKLIYVLMGIFAFLGLMTTLWFWNQMGFLYGEGSLLTQINFSRFHYLLPLTGLVLAVYAYSLLRNKVSQYIVAGLLLLGVGQHYLYYYDMHHFAPGSKEDNWFARISYREYFSTDLFAAIKADCDAHVGTDDYNVIGFGIQPAVLQYNGFNTCDSYQNFYPLQYEQDFNQITARELDKCPSLKTDSRFNIHNTCYLYSCETYEAPNKEEMDLPGAVHELLLDPDAIQHLHGRLIVSRHEVLSFGTDRIKEIKRYAHPENRHYTYIYIYEVL